MLQVETVELAGAKFQMHPIPPLEALKLDKEVISVMAPIINGLSGVIGSALSGDMSEDSMDQKFSNALETSLDIKDIISGVQQGLDSMDPDSFVIFIKKLFHNCTVSIPGFQPLELSSEDAINETFTRLGLVNVYKLAFEVMRYNKFSPFAVLEATGLQGKTDGLLKANPKDQENSNE
jgi:hypothetical protein